MPHAQTINRTGLRPVALETTLLCHGVPIDTAPSLADELADIVRSHGCSPAFVGVFKGQPVVGLNEAELAGMLQAETVLKANTANLGIAMFHELHAATTVSTTIELAAGAGVRFFATGGIGGVHRGYGTHLDISSDLAALTRFPVAVVTSGVKSLLDVVSTREALETLGIPVVGYRTSQFPAFYIRDGGCGVDSRFDDPASLAQFASCELARTGRGMVIANPIPEESEIPSEDWEHWLDLANAQAMRSGATGRDVTPSVLDHLHRISNGVTLEANLALIRSNVDLAAQLAAECENNRTSVNDKNV